MINKKQFSQKTIKRSILFVLFFFAFFTSRINAQGVDAVFFLDNSSSIDNTEWTDMSSSTKALIDEVLGCNTNNRIAVAHFAGFYTDPDALSTDPKIFLDKNFTNNATTAKSFVRRGGNASQGGTHYTTLGNETWLHENIALLQNSLGSSTASSQIVSPLKKLSRNPNNKLVIFIFTDAPATGNGLTKASFSSGGAFENYNIIKTTLGATIVIIQAPTGNGTTADTNSRAAAAAIASVGGSYNGTVQANLGDPQGSGTKPRKAVMSNVFDISNIDIETIADNICRSCAPTVEINAITPPTQDVCKNGTAQALVSNAVGTGTLSYQWYSNTTNSTTGGTLISGATSDTYAPPTSVLGTTYYFVEVADTFCEGKTKSAVVSVTVTTCCNAGTNAPALSSTTISPAPATVADLIAALSASNKPAGTNFTIHSSSSTTDANKLAASTAVIAGNTYYVAFWDSSNNCYSPTSQVYIAIPDSCLPDPYAAQQTWWLPTRWTLTEGNIGSTVMIDFQTGNAVLNNPVSGTFGHGAISSFEGNTSVTHPVTGDLLFVTDGDAIYRGSDGSKAVGGSIGGHPSSGESAAAIPDPQGVLGSDFIVFGNNTSNTPGGLSIGKYNLQTNTVSAVEPLLTGASIHEALEVIPHTNGTDYWILVNSVDQTVKSYLYSKLTGFNSTAVSSISVPDLSSANPSTFSIYSFISWDPRTPGKVLIARHNKIGFANFDPNDGTLGSWQVSINLSGTNAYQTGYSAAASLNGKYIYYIDKTSTPHYLKYYNTTSATTVTLGTFSGGAGNGLKIAPDGKLYITGSVDYPLFSKVLTGLYYYDGNPDSPTTVNTTTVLPIFNTGDRGVSLQLPNNVYWACLTCQAGSEAPALESANITSNPATVADLIALLSATNQPAGTVFTIHSGASATDANKLPNSTAIVPGTTYYASFFDGLAICYSPTSQVYIAIPDSCLPDPYAAQQTWWFGFGRGESESTRYGHIIRIDFDRSTGAAVLNNPPTGFLGQGDDTLGYEGHTNVTNPVTGEFLFGTDGNTIYRASDGTKATGGGIGGHFSAGQAAAVIPDPEGVLGKDFIVFGNTSDTSLNPAGLNMGKYNLENNTVLGITNLLADNATTGILEALQVVPKSNGRDYWILVISANAKVRVYEYTIAGGFNPSIISEISIPNTLGTTILGTSLSWIPQQENKIVIGMGYTVGIVDFNLNTGALANYETKVTTTNVVAGYSPVISPNGKYLYYVNSSGGLDYINLSDNTQTTIFPPNTTVGVYGIKVAPDGRLYFVNGTTDTVWYIDDANSPPTGMGSASQFSTGGKKSSLALPNNTYWSCEITVCQTGTNAPILASTTISSLPATVTDLISVLAVSNLPANTVLTIHSGSPATDSNQLASSTAIVAGSTYYVAFWDEFYGCYSPTTEINVINDTSTDCGDANRILHGDFTSLPASPGFKTASEIATLTNNEWTLTASNNSAVFWGHTTNASFGDGLQFQRDNQTQTLTQSLTNINNLETGHFPKLSISKFAAINGVGGVGSALQRGRSSTLIISYAGVEYAKVVTANGMNTNATLTYSNGATGSISTLLVGTVYNNWIITLPETVPQNGDFTLHFISGSGDANGGADDFAIGDLSICPPPYCTKPGDFTSGGVPTKVGITVQDKATTWPEAVPNGHIALESREKGFVITRVAHVSTTPNLTTDSVKDPKEGMLIYDIQDSCVKLFNGSTWNCLQRSCNDTN